MEFKNPDHRVVQINGKSRESVWGRFGLLLLTGAMGVGQAQDTLTLEQAVSRAGNYPSIEALRLEVQARKAFATQAGVFQNPHLSVDAENFAGTGPLSGTKALETTARLEQTLELGGKRTLRRERAEAEALLAEGELASGNRTITKTVRSLFDDLLAWQEKSLLAIRRVRFLEQASEQAQRRLEAGRGTVAETLKMQLELSRAASDAARIAGETEAAKIRLSSYLGAPTPDFSGVRGNFKQLEPLPSWEAVSENVLRHPDLIRWKSEKSLRLLSQKSARAENVPDLNFNAGLRQIRGPGQDNMALVGGVSIPLPLWNRNRAALAGASYRVTGAEQEELAARREMLARARTLWDGLRVRSAEVDRLATQLIPEAQKANAAAQTAYAAGRFSSLELLDGQRLLFEISEQYIEAQAAYHRDFAELDALAGPAHTFETKETK